MAEASESLSQGISLFQYFNDEETASVLSKMQRRKYGKGQVIIHHLSEENGVFFLLSGRVLAFLTSLEGTELAFDEIPKGSYFGELAAIDGGSRSASVCALTDVEVARLSSDEFLQLIESQPKFALALLKDFTHSIRRLSNRNFELATKSVPERVRSLVIREALVRSQLFDGGVLKPALTHAEIAQRVGARREAVSRALSELVGSGLIETQRQAIKILDADRLTELDGEGL